MIQKNGDRFKGLWEHGMVGVARDTLCRLPGPPGSPVWKDWFLMALVPFPTTLPTPASPKEHSLGHSVYGIRHAGPHCPPLYTQQQQTWLPVS